MGRWRRTCGSVRRPSGRRWVWSDTCAQELICTCCNRRASELTARSYSVSKAVTVTDGHVARWCARLPLSPSRLCVCVSLSREAYTHATLLHTRGSLRRCPAEANGQRQPIHPSETRHATRALFLARASPRPWLEPYAAWRDGRPVATRVRAHTHAYASAALADDSYT